MLHLLQLPASKALFLLGLSQQASLESLPPFSHLLHLQQEIVHESKLLRPMRSPVAECDDLSRLLCFQKRFRGVRQLLQLLLKFNQSQGTRVVQNSKALFGKV